MHEYLIYIYLYFAIVCLDGQIKSNWKMIYSNTVKQLPLIRIILILSVQKILYLLIFVMKYKAKECDF